jgi:AAA15 family ATPase/GTPase
MKIKSITVGGFKNISTTKLSLDRIAAIISTNNYGKSNLLEAIDFGCNFLSANPKERNAMMKWARAIPINKKLATSVFSFEIEFDDPNLAEYRFVRYGYKYEWYRDDGNGQRIIDEWIEARPTESVRYTSFLKRSEGKYRKEKDTISYRNIYLNDSQLAIDILSSIDDIAIHPVILTIKSFDYHVCSSLDLRDRFVSMPFEYVGSKGDESVLFDDRDVPRALYQLMQNYPEKYSLFLESVYTLFPEFIDVSVRPYEVRKDVKEIKLVAEPNKDAALSDSNKEIEDIPFRIRDEIYRVIITHKDLNQPIDMAMMSTGTKRVFWLLANVFIAGSKNISLIGVEELETSIHPRLLKRLLEILDEALDNTSIIISSHSPYLVQYFKLDRIFVGVPSREGIALFKKVKSSRAKALLSFARDLEMTVGEYLFELMSNDQDSADTLSFYLED